MIMIIGARTLAASTSAVNVFVNPGPRVTVACTAGCDSRRNISEAAGTRGFRWCGGIGFSIVTAIRMEAAEISAQFEMYSTD